LDFGNNPQIVRAAMNSLEHEREREIRATFTLCVRYLQTIAVQAKDMSTASH